MENKIDILHATHYIRKDQPQDGNKSQQDTETETYVDPISGMVTTVQRPKKKKQDNHATPSPSSTPPPSSSSPTINPYEPKKPPERSGDLASRLAAAVNDKPRSPDMKKSNKDTTLPRTSTESANISEPDVKKPAASEIADKTTKALDDKDVSTANEEDSETIATTPENEAAKDDDMAKLKEREETKDDGDDHQPRDEEQKGSEESIEKVEQEEEGQPVRMNQEDDVEKDIKEDNVDMEAPTKSIEKSTKEGGSDEQQQQQQPATDDTNNNNNQSVDIPEIKTDNKDTILQQREAQLFQAMQNIAQLHDQIHTLQEQADKDRRGYEDRIKELSSRPTAVSGGGDARSIKKLENTIEELQKQLKGKNEQIQGLMEEGIERWMELVEYVM